MSGADEAMTARRARELLGVGAKATPAELRRAFRVAAKTVHPDRAGGSAEAFHRMVAAYELLRRERPARDRFIQPPVAQPPRREAADPNLLCITPLIAFRGGEVDHRTREGRRLRIKAPAGLRTGDRLRVGEIVLRIAVRGDGQLMVRGDDLWLTLEVDRRLLEQGGRTRLETPLGWREIWITKKAAARGLVRLPEEGLPARGRHRQGHLFVRLQAVEETASSAARTLLRRFAAAWAA